MNKEPKRRVVRPAPKKQPPAKTKSAGRASPTLSKIGQVIGALRTSKGTSLSNLMALTGWQAHSVRGAIAGALKTKRGLSVISERKGDARVYRIIGQA